MQARAVTKWHAGLLDIQNRQEDAGLEGQNWRTGLLDVQDLKKDSDLEGHGWLIGLIDEALVEVLVAGQRRNRGTDL